ncbi:ParA family protein [Pseudodesulfovibrio pelocollis]|uniref:ParA family protein n=1 Tax=Pseudodesulfovibrio pelocollis TaxID=3051432 RepID=UPI00255B1C7D|nr:ParA family protein [Pseudodesulfovibrio sp. SB368]
MLRRVVVYLEKGGVGKTMTSIHLADGLARMGKKVTLIDLDPQGQCTVRLGLVNKEKPKIRLSEVIRSGWPEGMSNKERFKNLVMYARPNLFLIPGSRDLTPIQFQLASTGDWEGSLQRALGFFEDSAMDYVIMDTNPSWTPLSAIALFWGTELVFPVETSSSAAYSISHFQDELVKVQERKEGELEVVYILPTRKKNTRESEGIVEDLKTAYPDKFCEPIRERTAMAECGGHGETIWEYQPNDDSAEDYMNFVKKVMSREVR